MKAGDILISPAFTIMNILSAYSAENFTTNVSFLEKGFLSLDFVKAILLSLMKVV